MAIQEMVFTCDHCYAGDDSYRSVEDAAEFGWFIVRGPERVLGGDGEKVYCSQDCLTADIA